MSACQSEEGRVPIPCAAKSPIADQTAHLNELGLYVSKPFPAPTQFIQRNNEAVCAKQSELEAVGLRLRSKCKECKTPMG